MLDRGVSQQDAYKLAGDPYKIPGDPYKVSPQVQEVYPQNPQPPVHTFTASVELTVKASSKMEAAQMIRLMVLSSATPIRDFLIGDFTIQGE